MSRHRTTGQSWNDDPAQEVVSELYAEISRELGTDGPAETFGHPDDSRVGHLVENDHGMGSHDDHDYLANDSRDLTDLSIEEQAMHVISDEDLDADEAGLDPDITPKVRRSLGDV